MSVLRRRAIIVGANGQDGQLLADLLTKKGYELALVSRGQPDIADKGEVRKLVSTINPHEIYFLAAHHHSSEDAKESDEDLFRKSVDVHVVSAVNFLEAIATAVPAARFFYASSSHIYPDSNGVLLNESSPVRPGNIYAITKYSGMLSCRYYRDRRGVAASCGILFNHESTLRHAGYLSRKVAMAAAEISRRRHGMLTLGSLDALVDWGYAPDYVDAIYRILQLDEASDYVIASGKAHTVREFVNIAFRHVGLDYRAHVNVQPHVLTKRAEVRIGDASKLRRDTGWAPTVTFDEMVVAMVDAELKRL